MTSWRVWLRVAMAVAWISWLRWVWVWDWAFERLAGGRTNCDVHPDDWLDPPERMVYLFFKTADMASVDVWVGGLVFALPWGLLGMALARGGWWNLPAGVGLWWFYFMCVELGLFFG